MDYCVSSFNQLDKWKINSLIIKMESHLLFLSLLPILLLSSLFIMSAVLIIITYVLFISYITLSRRDKTFITLLCETSDDFSPANAKPFYSSKGSSHRERVNGRHLLFFV